MLLSFTFWHYAAMVGVTLLLRWWQQMSWTVCMLGGVAAVVFGPVGVEAAMANARHQQGLKAMTALVSGSASMSEAASKLRDYLATRIDPDDAQHAVSYAKDHDRPMLRVQYVLTYEFTPEITVETDFDDLLPGPGGAAVASSTE